MDKTYITLGIVTVISLLLAYYMGRRLVDPNWHKLLRRSIWLLLWLIALAVPALLYLRVQMLSHGRQLEFTVLLYALGLLSIVLFMTVVRDLVLALVHLVESMIAAHQKRSSNLQSYAAYDKQLQRRAFMVKATRLAAWVGTVGMFGRSAVDAHDLGPTLVMVDVPIANLPEALNGVKIVQISDLHIGQIQNAPQLIEAVVKAVASVQPDVVALTGDMADGLVKDLSVVAAPLASIQAKYGKYFVTGNHEYYTETPENWLAQWQKFGYRALQNEHAVLTIQGERLVVAGVHDLHAAKRHKTHVCSPQLALKDAPSVPTILLAHHPDTIKLADGLKIDLQLSGHTHAGQYFPGTLIVRWVHAMSAGLNRYRNSWVYVNTGTGYWGPPLRSTDVLSEISVLTLRRV